MQAQRLPCFVTPYFVTEGDPDRVSLFCRNPAPSPRTHRARCREKTGFRLSPENASEQAREKKPPQKPQVVAGHAGSREGNRGARS